MKQSMTKTAIQTASGHTRRIGNSSSDMLSFSGKVCCPLGNDKPECCDDIAINDDPECCDRDAFAPNPDISAVINFVFLTFDVDESAVSVLVLTFTLDDSPMVDVNASAASVFVLTFISDSPTVDDFSLLLESEPYSVPVPPGTL